MNKPTIELLQEAANSDNIEKFLKVNQTEMLTQTVQEHLKQLQYKKDMKISQIAAASEKGEYVYKVFHGDKPASRDLLICIARAMNLNLEETQLLLRIANFSRLDPRNKRDSVILFGISKNLTVRQINEILDDLNEKVF